MVQATGQCPARQKVPIQNVIKKAATAKSHNRLILLEPLNGIEPLTYALRERRSTI